ncbi:hypothetical protein GGS26DRAFT_549807 [Hypomontagnella submonticulosa]|nr:hypothetical protein GGS26DRAFT_549807 [Hypomontagnella submonticulosa]
MTATVSGFSSMWPAPLLLVLSVFTGAIQAQDPGPTTVPVFLPAYKPQDWSSLRGSIVTSNDAETVYTVFCAQNVSATYSGRTITHCQIGDLVPFTFTEGPSTLHIGDQIESTISITLGCTLTGTTAATCSGETILSSSFRFGGLTGPTSTSAAPSTLSGEQVGWGVLTLAEPPLTSTSRSRTITYYPSTTTGPSGGGNGGGSGSESGSGSTGSSASEPTATTATVTAASTPATPTSGVERLGGGGGGVGWMVAGSLVLDTLVSAMLL